MSTLRLVDEATADDLRTFVARAGRTDRDAAIRLQAQGAVLAAYVPVLPGSGLSAEGLVLGMRAMGLAEPADLDVTVPLAGVLDRFARDAGTVLPVPPTEVRAPWAGQSPPRAGWERRGDLAPEELRRAAEEGIAEVARGAGAGSGELAVADLRRRVWARPLAVGSDDGCTIPSGVALAAHVLGFLGPAPAAVLTAGRWVRLSTPAGHVLAR